MNRLFLFLFFLLWLLTPSFGQAGTGYLDVPKDHWAREALDELVDAGIIEPGLGQKYWGNDPVDQYHLVSFLAKIIENLIVGPGGELSLADASLGYKDVNATNPFYPSIQKLIPLGVIPPGLKQTLFKGDALVNRYQLAYFLFTPLEKILGPNVEFPPAPSAEAYQDIPSSHYTYPVIQKLIKLGVFPGKETFSGDTPATRYWLAYFSVNLIKQVYLKLKEQEIISPPLIYHELRTILGTNFFTSYARTLPLPQTFNFVETLNFSWNHPINNNLSAYINLQNQFSLGKPNYQDLLRLGETFLNLNNTFQLGKIYNYFSLSPSGASLILDNINESITLNLNSRPGKITALIGRLPALNKLASAPTFGSMILTFTPSAPLNFSIGGSLINKPLDPTGTFQLPLKIQQLYGGTKLSLWNWDLAFESSNVAYSDPTIFPFINPTTEVDNSAIQSSLTCNFPENGYSLSFGYERVGNNFYPGSLADPSLATNCPPGCEAIMLLNHSLVEGGYVFDLNLYRIHYQGENISNHASFLFSRSVSGQASINFGLNGNFDPVFNNRLDSLNFKAGVSLSN